MCSMVAASYYYPVRYNNWLGPKKARRDVERAGGYRSSVQRFVLTIDDMYAHAMLVRHRARPYV
jgi:hypothetical protein